MSTTRVDQLRDVAARVFDRQESTLEEEASAFELDVLAGTVKAVRRMLRLAVRTAPDSAFEAQADDPDGNEVWSAGQVVSHVTSMAVWTQNNINAILGREPLAPSNEMAAYRGASMLSREEALAELKRSDERLNVILASIGDISLSEKTVVHERFGVIGIKGWLLFMALHEGSHVKQINDLNPEL